MRIIVWRRALPPSFSDGDPAAANDSRRKFKLAKKKSSFENGNERKNDFSDERKNKKKSNPSSLTGQLFVILLCVTAFFLLLCYVIALLSDNQEIIGVVGTFLSDWSFGLLGGSAILIPLLMFNHALFFKRDVESGAVRYKWIFSIVEVLSVSLFVASITPSIGYDGQNLIENGRKLIGGGWIGGKLAHLTRRGVGTVGTAIFSFMFIIIFGMLIFGLTPAVLWEKIKFYAVCAMERRGAAKAKKQEKQDEKIKKSEKLKEDIEPYVKKKARRGKVDEEIFRDDEKQLTSEVQNTETDEEKTEEYELDDIFGEHEDEELRQRYSKSSEEEESSSDDDMSAQTEIKLDKKRKKTVRTDEPLPIPLPVPEPEKPAEPEYKFPPIDLLPLGKKAGGGDAESEISVNSKKIEEILDSFNIRVHVVSVSRGPAVTRYEVAPEQGVKVNAIANRVDDISLGLAATGVIVEGVIPGKSAIGIEVPNKSVSLVYLRELIDTDDFRSAKSKINAALGIDLTGTRMYADIAKMPHLLIAGATGMGKSVCMNSIIVSLLYKATPDEVKFIFIDPKKVELNVYNGLPHLIVPVVSDPKKAAGALHWCVVEMERRYDILERMGKRNLAQYNAATADDPTAERLPQIVIVIDELADLMTTVRDEVEIPISRIAAKARAAGLHLIIGTQRPSVDVLTGTIKANIPSRIAFTTSSQIDSRTIIDTVGAEKLVGKGDMLYVPVGARVPYRVQGAFVDEEEIENIVKFIKDNCGECSYSKEVAETIEKEAELCGKKGKGAQSEPRGDAGSPDEDDPLLDAAIELAVENQKVATSLLQRRLSVGYGRAAKIIDIMERRGIVSKPDGQKPRNVLITQEQYYEMKMRSSDANETDDGDE